MFLELEYKASWISMRRVSHFPFLLARVDVTGHRYPEFIPELKMQLVGDLAVKSHMEGNFKFDLFSPLSVSGKDIIVQSHPPPITWQTTHPPFSFSFSFSYHCNLNFESESTLFSLRAEGHHNVSPLSEHSPKTSLMGRGVRQWRLFSSRALSPFQTAGETVRFQMWKFKGTFEEKRREGGVSGQWMRI